jgi:hypothetical protein
VHDAHSTFADAIPDHDFSPFEADLAPDADATLGTFGYLWRSALRAEACLVLDDVFARGAEGHDERIP